MGWEEEKGAVGMHYCELGVGGWVEEGEDGLVGGWVGGLITYLSIDPRSLHTIMNMGFGKGEDRGSSCLCMHSA